MAKGLYGLHHGVITAAAIGITHAFTPEYTDHIAVGMMFWYVSREYNQYENRLVHIDSPWYKNIEWWDAMTPLVVGQLWINILK